MIHTSDTITRLNYWLVAHKNSGDCTLPIKVSLHLNTGGFYDVSINHWDGAATTGGNNFSVPSGSWNQQEAYVDSSCNTSGVTISRDY